MKRLMHGSLPLPEGKTIHAIRPRGITRLGAASGIGNFQLQMASLQNGWENWKRFRIIIVIALRMKILDAAKETLLSVATKKDNLRGKKTSQAPLNKIPDSLLHIDAVPPPPGHVPFIWEDQ